MSARYGKSSGSYKPSVSVTPRDWDAFTPSDQQAAIKAALLGTTAHLQIVARAGTGKSTTQEWLTTFLPADSYVILAFNKAIADAAKARGLNAATTHSLGNGAFFSAGMRPRLNQWKVRDMLPSDMPTFEQAGIEKLVSMCKANLLTGADPDELEALAYQYGLDVANPSATYARIPELLQRCLADTTAIDFDDMIWMPVMLGLRPRTYQCVMVDEAQDINRAQMALCLEALGDAQSAAPISGLTMRKREQGRMILVGDDRQSIYAFRGADSDAMGRMYDTLAATPRGCTVLPLTLTRRCPVSVTNLAKRLVSDFECPTDAPLGTITRVGDSLPMPVHEHYGYDSDDGPQACPICDEWGTKSDQCVPALPSKGEMVLCRTNAPIVGVAYELLRANVPVKIQGRDFAKSLATTIKRLANERDTVEVLTAALSTYQMNEQGRIMAERKGNVENKLQALDDKCECITALCEGMTLVSDVLNRIDLLFTDVNQGTDASAYVLLSSVHRAKGLESHTVRILRPDLMPHPMAKQPWEHRQEQNLMYVAITRAQDTLIWHGGSPL